MSSPKKRKSTEPATPEPAKRPRGTAPATPGASASDGAFKLSVQMSKDFMVYPVKLLDKIQNQHESLANFLMSKFETDVALQLPYTYTVTRKSTSVPRDPGLDFINTRPEVFPALSFANKQALEEFFTKVPSKKTKFTELEMPQDMKPRANPDFAGLQSVGHGCMGWGFDRWGCISLHLTILSDGKMKHESIYVERRRIRHNDDEEVQIVENPNAART